MHFSNKIGTFWSRINCKNKRKKCFIHFIPTPLVSLYEQSKVWLSFYEHLYLLRWKFYTAPDFNRPRFFTSCSNIMALSSNANFATSVVIDYCNLVCIYFLCIFNICDRVEFCKWIILYWSGVMETTRNVIFWRSIYIFKTFIIFYLLK